MTTPQTIAIGYIATIVIASVLLGLWWASSDNKKRLANIANAVKEGLPHGDLLAWRLVALLFGCFGAWVWLKVQGSPMWLLAPTATLAWAVFGIVHVFRLNRLMKASRWYMSIGNVWDHTWIRLSFRKRGSFGRKMKWKEHGKWVTMMVRDYPHSDEVMRSIYKAGKRSFYFRLAVAIASTAVIVFA